MRNVEMVQMLVQMATLAVVSIIAFQLAQLTHLLRRHFCWEMSSSSRVVRALGSSRVPSQEDTGFAVWVWRDGTWTMEHDRSESAYCPSKPPQSPGAFVGERVRTCSISKA